VCLKTKHSNTLLRQQKGRRSVFLREESGATAVEFVLILPLLLALIIGLIDFGRIGFVQVSVTAASREGARFSSLYSSGITNIQTLNDFVQNSTPTVARVSQLDSQGSLSVTTTQCSAIQSGENTSVTVATNFKWLLPVGLISILNPGSTWVQDFTISSTGTMRCMN
jgi:Flp pilus assembly protein TadG